MSWLFHWKKQNSGFFSFCSTFRASWQVISYPEHSNINSLRANLALANTPTPSQVKHTHTKDTCYVFLLHWSYLANKYICSKRFIKNSAGSTQILHWSLYQSFSNMCLGSFQVCTTMMMMPFYWGFDFTSPTWQAIQYTQIGKIFERLMQLKLHIKIHGNECAVFLFMKYSSR